MNALSEPPNRPSHRAVAAPPASRPSLVGVLAIAAGLHAIVLLACWVQAGRGTMDDAGWQLVEPSVPAAARPAAEPS